MTRLFIRESISIGTAAKRELDHGRDSKLTQVGPATTPFLHQLATASPHAADAAVSSGPVTRLDGLPDCRRQDVGVERIDGDRVAAEAQRQVEAAQRHGVSADVVVERLTGEPESR